MLLEYDDDDVVTWGWPWHGLVDSVDGLHHPQRSIPYSAVQGGVSTTLFDLGRDPVETPAEVASQGGELWSKAILRWWRLSTSTNHGVITAPGFALRGAPIVQQNEGGLPEVVVWTSATLRISNHVEFRGQHRLPSGVSWSFGQTWERDAAGQGDGQPDVDVFGFGLAAGRYIHPLSTANMLEGVLLDIRGNRLLYGLVAESRYVPGGNSVSLSIYEEPTLLLGLVEIEIDIVGGSGVQLRIVEDRAAALGQFERQDSGEAWSGPLLYWHPWVVEHDNVDDGNCSGSRTSTTPGGWAPAMPGGIATIWNDHRDNTASRHSIVGGLLLARYGSDGEIETARYDAVHELVRDIEHKHENSGSDRVTTTYQKIENQCHLSTTSNYSSVTWSRREFSELRIRQAIYGFDGSLVDEETFHGVARFEQVRLYSRENIGSSDVLSEVPGSRVVKINGVEHTYDWDTAPFAQNHFRASRGGRGAGLLAGRAVSLSAEYRWSYPTIWMLSNSLACISRRASDTGYITAGPAVTPSGPHWVSYTSEHDFTTQRRASAAMTFLSGSWNPITGEVARCGQDRRFSWA